jgi:ornithine racemase
MTAPRLEIDLDKISHNARNLVGRLAPRGIRVTGVTKAALGTPAVAEAMVRGGVGALGDSRVENLVRMRAGGIAMPITLIRSPMLSQVDAVVTLADTSCNSELAVLTRLSDAAVARDTTHAVVLMVELGDLREGVAVGDVLDLARQARRLPNIKLVGLGTNLACQNGVAPDRHNMAELSRLADAVESTFGIELDVVSGGNSANLDWACTTDDPGRINDLRLGESILLGREPLHRRPIEGLHTDAITLVAEVIEAKEKPAQPWGEIAQAAFDGGPPRRGTGTVRQLLLAVGRQDVDADGLTAPIGTHVLGASSDHLVVDAGDGGADIGDELAFQLNYSALVRAMTSPFVAQLTTGGRGPS